MAGSVTLITRSNCSISVDASDSISVDSSDSISVDTSDSDSDIDIDIAVAMALASGACRCYCGRTKGCQSSIDAVDFKRLYRLTMDEFNSLHSTRIAE